MRRPTPSQERDVVRVDTELVQSPVTVFDKQGRFVEGLEREQFELRIDGQPRAISFFDHLTAGSPAEALKYEARKNSATVPSNYGRLLFFFIDDFHLSADSVNRIRTALTNFIDNSMGQNDRAIVTTASGQLGFLQQLTDSKDALHAAVDRLKHRQFFTPDEARPPMGPYQAMAIQRNDSQVLQYFVEMAFQDSLQNMIKQPPSLPGNKNASAMKQMAGETARRQAEIGVRSRAQNVLHQYSAISASSLAALEYLMSSTVAFPGSKLIILFSDGFLLNSQVAGEQQRLQEISSAATRAGAVIYSIQASGLGTTAPGADALVRLGPDEGTGQVGLGEDTAAQAPLFALAADTGGRALFNSNSLEGSIKQALGETSEYYLLAWRPETAAQHAGTLGQIQVSIKDHPEWTVRVRKGYLSLAPKTSAGAGSKTSAADSQPADKLQAAEEKIRGTLSALYPVKDLPTFISVSFLDVLSEGGQIMIASEVSPATTPNERQHPLIELLGAVFNDDGKAVSTFREKLTAYGASTTPPQVVSQITQIKLKPGLYQVRVAARDETSGLTGSAAQWILVPDLTARRLALSGILIGDTTLGPGAATIPASDQRVSFSISRRFTKASRLRFMTYVYNAARGLDGRNAPDVTVQMHLTCDDKIVFTGPQVKIGVEALDDLARLPYAAELSLRTLPSGNYALLVTATDAATKASTTQRIKFMIE